MIYSKKRHEMIYSKKRHGKGVKFMKGMKFFCKGFAALLLVLSVLGMASVRAQASDFDPAFYAAQYPDVVAAYGKDPNALYSHYVNFGINEGRFKMRRKLHQENMRRIAHLQLMWTLISTTRP